MKSLGSCNLTTLCTGVAVRLRGGGETRDLLLARMERTGGVCGREEGWETGVEEGVAIVGDAEDRWAESVPPGKTPEGCRVSFLVIHAYHQVSSAIAQDG